MSIFFWNLQPCLQTWFTEVLLDDGPSFFFLKVSKIFHKTANSFSVYIFLCLRNQKSKMREVIFWNVCFEAKLIKKAIINIIFVWTCCLYVTLNIQKKQRKTKKLNFWLFSSNSNQKHKSQEITLRIFDFWFLRHRKMKTADFCSLVKGFGNF